MSNVLDRKTWNIAERLIAMAKWVSENDNIDKIEYMVLLHLHVDMLKVESDILAIKLKEPSV